MVVVLVQIIKMQALDFQILRDNWMIIESSLQAHYEAALNYFAGKEISTGLFSKLSLPNVPDNVALIPVNGVMTKADICGGMGTRSIANAITAAAADKSKTSILLYFENVPGGQVDGTEALAQAIIAAKAQKPVISMTSGMTCSAGVWAASQSTEWYATSATDNIGCIGVVGRMKNPAAADSADYVDVYSDLSPDKNAEFRSVEVMKKNILNPVAKMFQNAVMAGRGSKLKIEKEGLLTGSTMVATAAKKGGLIDGVMPMDKVIKRASYLGNKNKTTMSATAATTENFVFQNILQAAGAYAAIPCEEGFALTETQMNTLDAAIAATAQQLATANGSIEALNQTIADNATAATEAQNQIATLQARVAELEKGPAAIAPDPAATADPGKGANKYATSYDEEIKAHKKLMGM